MCGRYTLLDVQQAEKALRRLGVIIKDGLPVRYNVAPTQTMPVVVGLANGPILLAMRWGSHWRDDQGKVQLSINARSEKATFTRFKHAVTQRRCIVPADGFFEWDRSKKPSTPYLFRMATTETFWMAGAWEERTGEFPDGYLVFTTAPNALVAPIHDRMPAILTDEAARAWLQPGPIATSQIKELCATYPADKMNALIVGPAVNNARNDGPECVAPAGPIPSETPDQGLLF